MKTRLVKIACSAIVLFGAAVGFGGNVVAQSWIPTDISVGGATYLESGHRLALMNDGSVRAWGDNSFGQLGFGDALNRTEAATIPGLSGVTQVYAGNGFSVALLTDGTVKTWGDNSYGQLVSYRSYSCFFCMVFRLCLT